MASEKVKLSIHTNMHEENAPEIQSQRRKHRRLPIKNHISFQERLLRNTCLSCAVLLGILALGNVQQPWAKHASASIEKALTMEINLDQSLGQLRFVQKLMPESALVFFNLDGNNEYMPPVHGEPIHCYSDLQPWLMFACGNNNTVCASADGIVSAISPMSDGGYGILIDHGNGIESVTACINEHTVQVGATVLKGAVIGKADENVYYELRSNGKPLDPTEKMGL